MPNLSIALLNLIGGTPGSQPELLPETDTGEFLSLLDIGSDQEGSNLTTDKESREDRKTDDPIAAPLEVPTTLFVENKSARESIEKNTVEVLTQPTSGSAEKPEDETPPAATHAPRDIPHRRASDKAAGSEPTVPAQAAAIDHTDHVTAPTTDTEVAETTDTAPDTGTVASLLADLRHQLRELSHMISDILKMISGADASAPVEGQTTTVRGFSFNAFNISSWNMQGCIPGLEKQDMMHAHNGVAQNFSFTSVSMASLLLVSNGNVINHENAAGAEPQQVALPSGLFNDIQSLLQKLQDFFKPETTATVEIAEATPSEMDLTDLFIGGFAPVQEENKEDAITLQEFVKGLKAGVQTLRQQLTPQADQVIQADTAPADPEQITLWQQTLKQTLQTIHLLLSTDAQDSLSPDAAVGANTEVPAKHGVLSPSFLSMFADKPSSHAVAAVDAALTQVPQQSNAVNNPVLTLAASTSSTGSDSGGTSSNSGGGNQGQPQPLPAVANASANAAQHVANSAAGSFARALSQASSESIANQVAFQIKTAIGDGSSKISIQLHPAELGKLDIKLNVAADGKTGVTITADNKNTLDLLQRDTSGLQRALADAGLTADSGNLNFNLRGDQQDTAQDNAHAAQHYQKAAPEEENVASDVIYKSYVVNLAEGLDIRI